VPQADIELSSVQAFIPAASYALAADRMPSSSKTRTSASKPFGLTAPTGLKRNCASAAAALVRDPQCSARRGVGDPQPNDQQQLSQFFPPDRRDVLAGFRTVAL
jgi:hypothetical protein